MKDIKSLILDASAHLKKQGVAEPEREARSLMGFALGKEQSFLRGHPEYIPGTGEHALFVEYVNRRGRREPLQHITGKQEFYGLDFMVNRSVLVPRPETELVVETAIQQFRFHEDPFFCDVGTGSGCIAVSLLKHLPRSLCIATDISGEAIAVAKRNARRHATEGRFHPVVADIVDSFAAVPLFDLIVANPPYVPKEDLESLQAEVRLYDPEVALTDSADGSSIIRRIESSSYLRLKDPGTLIMEIGFKQAATVEEIFEKGPWVSFELKADLQGIPRVICAKKST